jgi:hypothetical protein
MSTTNRQDKAWSLKGYTDGRPHWQEALDRYTSIPASRSVEAAEVIGGLAGSWASAYVLGSSVLGTSNPLSPPVAQEAVSRLGMPGVPEINFRPYDHGTHRFATKGPSLLGHPISFSVYGPTLKYPKCIHQWRVDTSGANDTLTVDDISALSTVAASDAFINRMWDLYSPDMGDEIDRGLYLVISATGSEGVLTSTGVGGLGDGLTGQDVGPVRVPASPKDATSKFEIFRVTSVDLTGGGTGLGIVTLDSGKRLSDYFDFTAGPGDLDSVRAVTFLRPEVARVVAVPGSGAKGRETVFAIVPPEESLPSDYQPYYQDWIGAGGFDPWWDLGASAVLGTGVSKMWRDNPVLPVPRPIRAGTGNILGESGGSLPMYGNVGIQVVEVPQGLLSADDEGKVLRLYEVEQVQGAVLPQVSDWGLVGVEGGRRGLDTLLGYFEIHDFAAGATTDFIALRRIVEFNPETGVPFYGDNALLQLLAAAPGSRILFKWTLHNPVSSLWDTSNLSIRDISSARLTHLIDPSWVGTSIKSSLPEGALSRADRAIFDTSSSGAGASGTNANPGSLLDLGFRAVLYPGKEDKGKIIPDFDNPIQSHEVILNPDNTTSQYYEVDYSAGLVYLSEPPKAGSGCTLCPDAALLSGAHNPSGTMTFFVACVPYSREAGQMGANPRVSAGAVSYVDDCSEWAHPASVMGYPYYWPLAGQVITCGSVLSGGSDRILLDERLTGQDLPPTGFVTVLQGKGLDGAPGFTDVGGKWLATFGYTQVLYSDPLNSGNTTLLGIWGGGASGDTLDTSTVSSVAVMHRQPVMPNKGDGSVGVDLRNDGSYGSAWRASGLHFEGGFLEPTVDGGVLIRVRDPEAAASAAALGDVFSNEIISGGKISAGVGVVDAVYHVDTSVILNRGRRQEVPAQSGAIPAANTNVYVYLDCSKGDIPCCPPLAWTETLPLPDSHDILLGRVEHDGGAPPAITKIVEVKNYLLDVDERVDIVVGDYITDGGGKQDAPHFRKLSEAMSYIGEIMDPVNVGGTAGSDPGRRWRILVNGPVDETDLTGPIVVPTSGVTVIGTGISDLVGTSIVWDGNFSLFDLNGQNHFTLEGLSFLYDEGSAPGSTPNRALIYNTSGDVTGLQVRRCSFYGSNAHAFLSFQGTFPVRTTLQDSVIEDNISTTHDSFVLVVSDGSSGSQNLVIRHNRAQTEGNSPTVGASEDQAAAVHLTGGKGVTVEDNDFSLFWRGVLLRGLWGVAPIVGSTVHNNRIETTHFGGITAMYTTAGLTISNNHLLDVHTALTQDPTVGGGIAGALSVDIDSSGALLSENYVERSATSSTPTSPALDVRGSTHRVLDNIIQKGSLNLYGEYFQVKGNQVWQAGSQILSEGNSAAQFQDNFANHLALSGQGLVVIGNWAQSCNLAGTGCTITGNVISGSVILALNESDALVSSSFVGNYMTSLYVAKSFGSAQTLKVHNVTIANNVVTGITYLTDVVGGRTADCGDIVWVGNHFGGNVQTGVVGTDRDGILGSQQFTSNYVTGNLILATAGTAAGRKTTGTLYVGLSGNTIAGSLTLAGGATLATNLGASVVLAQIQGNVVAGSTFLAASGSGTSQSGGAVNGVVASGNIFQGSVVAAAGGGGTADNGAGVTTLHFTNNFMGASLICAAAGTAGTDNGGWVDRVHVQGCYFTGVSQRVTLAAGFGSGANNAAYCTEPLVAGCFFVSDGQTITAASGGTSSGGSSGAGAVRPMIVGNVFFGNSAGIRCAAGSPIPVYSLNGAGASSPRIISNFIYGDNSSIVCASGSSGGVDNGGRAGFPIIMGNILRSASAGAATSNIVCAAAGTGGSRNGLAAVEPRITNNVVFGEDSAIIIAAGTSSGSDNGAGCQNAVVENNQCCVVLAAQKGSVIGNEGFALDPVIRGNYLGIPTAERGWIQCADGDGIVAGPAAAVKPVIQNNYLYSTNKGGVGGHIICASIGATCDEPVVTGNVFRQGLASDCRIFVNPFVTAMVIGNHRCRGVYSSFNNGGALPVATAGPINDVIVLGNVLTDATPLFGNALNTQGSQLAIPYHEAGGDAAHAAGYQATAGLGQAIDHNIAG